jgi:hypothetical protein
MRFAGRIQGAVRIVYVVLERWRFQSEDKPSSFRKDPKIKGISKVIVISHEDRLTYEAEKRALWRS